MESNMTESWNGYIRMQPELSTVSVIVAGTEVARTTNAIRFFEGEREPVFYIPLRDVNQALFTTSNHHTRCKWKGEADYKHFSHAGQTIQNILWMYRTPFDEVALIKDFASFDLGQAVVKVD